MNERPVSEHRTILVTGGPGTLGMELVGRWAAAGDAKIVALARYVKRASSAMPSSVRPVVCDVRAGHTLGLGLSDQRELAASVTDIVHCAAETTFNRPLA